jgi:hypothetical protein
MHTDADVDERARSLVRHLSHRLRNGLLCGSMSVNLYDTAWVSMVIKNVNGERTWLFPSSFELLLNEQLPEGGWDNGSSEFDSVITSLASLLALVEHQKEHPLVTGCSLPQDIDTRIQRAKRWLQERLDEWDLESTDRVGFEILLPSLLRLLTSHNIVFTFPCLLALMKLNAKKLAMLPSTFLEGPSSAAIHSLEAFVGVIDFDKIDAQLADGSFMASPAATAAYLIFSTSWNDKAESYLTQVFEHGQGHRSGAFPSAFPSEVFEVSWVCVCSALIIFRAVTQFALRCCPRCSKQALLRMS